MINKDLLQKAIDQSETIISVTADRHSSFLRINKGPHGIDLVKFKDVKMVECSPSHVVYSPIFNEDVNQKTKKMWQQKFPLMIRLLIEGSGGHSYFFTDIKLRNEIANDICNYL